jgi:hypothetical protein
MKRCKSLAIRSGMFRRRSKYLEKNLMVTICLKYIESIFREKSIKCPA